MKPFCETMVQDVFPTIRALIAKELSKMGYTQSEIALKLSVTQPAVSQYSRELRGKKAKTILENEKAMERIRAAARNIAKDGRAYAREMCGICRVLRESGILCLFCDEPVSSRNSCTECMKETLANTCG